MGKGSIAEGGDTKSDPGSPGSKKKKMLAPPIIKPPVEKSGGGPEIPGGRKGQKEANKAKAKAEGKVKKKKKKGDKKGGKKGGAPRKRKKNLVDRIYGLFGYASGNVQLRDPRAMEAVQALDLQMIHLRRLKYTFDKIDIDGSGNIDAEELFESMGQSRSPFTDKLFALIDLDGNGGIEFDEYVRVLATYCMFTKDEILRFCFECFDVDSSGTIDEKEFIELCKVVNNASPAFPQNFKRALEEFDVNEDGLIDYSEFIELDRRYPLVLFPAFRMQDTMQTSSLGEKGWQKIIEGYKRNQDIEEYKAAHGGKLPPDKFTTKLGKMFFPCLYRQRQHIKVGAAMEAKHRAGSA